MSKYPAKLCRSECEPRLLASIFIPERNKFLDTAHDAPLNCKGVYGCLAKGKIKHDIHIEDDAIFVKTARQISLRIAYTILLIGLFIGATILIVWDSEQKFGYFILYLSSTLIMLLLVRWLFIRK